MCFRELQSAETADTETEIECGEEETKLSSDTNLGVEAVCDVKGPEEQEEECEKRDVEMVKTVSKEEDKTGSEKKYTEKTEDENGARRKRSEDERKIEGESDYKDVEYEDQYEKYDVSSRSRIRKTRSGKRKKKTVMKESGGSEETCAEKRKNNRRTEGRVDRNWKKTEQKKAGKKEEEEEQKNKMTEPSREEFHSSVVNAGIFR